MKIFAKIFAVLLVISMLAGCFVACDNGEQNNDENNNSDNNEVLEFVDYVATVKFDKNSGRANAEVKLKSFVDGDTTHFYVPTSVNSSGILKARYLAINTPESTGQVEPWGKKASNFTKEALSKATSIIVESDTATWDLDSTGDRHLVWVWYKTAESEDYINLNLEILQAGLALASKASDNSYGDACVKILSQAMAHKLCVYSKEKDPDFYYGSAQPLTLKELKTNIEAYEGTRVSFEGVVIRNSGQSAYIEEYDDETGRYFGMQVYFGWSLDYNGQEILTVGNRVLIVGVVQGPQNGRTWQLSDIKYHSMRPDHEDNIKLISQGHVGAYTEVNATDIINGKINLDITETDDDGNETIVSKTYNAGFLIMHSSASMTNLTVKSMYTSDNSEISITCQDANGVQIVVRTEKLKDANGATVTEDYFPIGSVINVKGVVDMFNDEYQLRVFSVDDITFVD